MRSDVAFGRGLSVVGMDRAETLTRRSSMNRSLAHRQIVAQPPLLNKHTAHLLHHEHAALSPASGAIELRPG
jgi:hypothetical protein